MTKKDKAKAELRRAGREQRREAQRREAVRRRQRRILVWIAAGAVVLLGGGLLLARSGVLGQQAAALFGRQSEPPPGERVRDVGNPHIPQGTKGTGYASNPPTSGEHYQNEAQWGVYAQPLPDELVIHNLEHGGIWISYRDPTDTDLAARLERVARRYRTKVIVTPRPQNDAPIAVAAWGHLLKLQAFDEEKIVAFINAYRGRVGPEPNAP